MTIMYPLMVVAVGIARLNDGEPLLGDPAELLLSGLPAIGPALVFVLAGAGRGWQLRTSPEGLALVPPRAGVLQPLKHEIRYSWGEIASVRLKYRGPWRSLVVRPRTGTSATVRTAFLRPGSAELMHDLAQRLPRHGPAAVLPE